jgi:Mrp family chromosome partitioning ATPase
MDRIRKALDLARLQREEPAALRSGLGSEPSARDQAADVAAGAADTIGGGAAARPGPGLSPPILYRHTRVFAPSAEVLEANRVIGPASDDAAAGAFRMLRTQVLQRMDANGWRSLAIFSPGANDGKTTLAINLAVSLAGDRRHTVMLVDFDFKRAALASRWGLAPEFGGDDALTGTARVQDCLYHPDGFERLVLLPARSTLAHSSEILAGPRSRELVEDIRARYPERIIVFDLPPVLSADDALAFAPLVQCGLVVAAEGLTRRSDLVRTIELLHKTPLLGTVLNRAADAPAGY